jgi:sterol desaturase/sphingolipid hydroxylase (fatty acid hydroxylase superfamily)
MESFVQFFEELSDLQKFGWIVICMTFFWIVEGANPLFKFNYKKWSHAKTNLFLLSTTIIINVLFGLLTAGVFIWIQDNQFGILHIVDLPLWVEFILGIMLLDFFAQYVVHYLLHKVKFMWKFHMVHHSDTAVDVTTGTRHHPGDYVFREIFALFSILIGGLPIAFYLAYRIFTVFFTYLSHANLNMPTWLDKGMSILFITPNMHKFHHHFERPWTDSNYGNIFSLWDRIFGTFVYDNPKKIVYGLDVLDDSRSNDLKYQLKVPFDNTIKTDY